jgi:hypothetical protein
MGLLGLVHRREWAPEILAGVPIGAFASAGLRP